MLYDVREQCTRMTRVVLSLAAYDNPRRMRI